MRVIDYKSSIRKLRLSEVYYGLALQLLVYLVAVVENAERLIKTKVTCRRSILPMTDPIIPAKAPLPDDDLEKQRMKKLQMDGIIVGDAGVIELMDSQVKEGGISSLVAAGVTKAGKPRKGLSACVIPEEKYEVLSEFLKGKIKELSQAIRNGEIAIKPYRQGTSRACEYCDYKPVCGLIS